MLPEAVRAMTAQLTVTGNASSLHAAGRRARRAVEESREALAAALGARPSEVVFTAGGTEADNLAVKGLFWARRAADPARNRVLASPVEHHAVLDALHWLADHEGAVVDWLPVDGYGRVHARGAARGDRPRPRRRRPGHRDVGQQRGRHHPADPRTGRSGTGVRRPAALRRGAGVRPGRVGLRGQRAGRDDGQRAQDRRPVRYRRAAAAPRVARPCRCCTAAARSATCAPAPSTCPSIVGLRHRRRAGRRAAASDFVREVAALRDRPGRGAVRAAVPDAVLNGDPAPGGRLPANAHFSFPGCEGDSLLLLLDAQGIECSTGSACTAGVAQPSHVLLAMGADQRPGPRHAALLPRPHLHHRRTWRTPPRPSDRSSSGPAAPAWSDRARTLDPL